MLRNDEKSEIPSTGDRNGFLGKVRGLSLFDKVKITDIRQSLNIEPLLIFLFILSLYLSSLQDSDEGANT